MFLNLTILNIILFFLYFLISSHFSNKLRLIDYPTKIKNHSEPTPAIGGLIFFLIYLTIYLQLFLNFKLNDFYHYLTFFTFSYLKVNFNFQDISKSKEIFLKILDDETLNNMPLDIIDKT